MRQKDYFNAVAENWDSTNHHNLIKADLMVGMLDIKLGQKVLDVGCGTVVLLPILMHYTDSINITAIDEAEKMIEVAQRKFAQTNIHFIADDVLCRTDLVNKFDFIVCYSMFPHFSNKLKAIRKLTEFLIVGGKLAVLHSSARQNINSVHRNLTNTVVQHDTLPDADTLMQYMDHSGLREEILIDNETMYLVCARKL